MEYQHFFNISINALNKHAPMKPKYLKENQGRFIKKNLHKQILNVVELQKSFCAVAQKFIEKNTKTNLTLA